MMTTLTLPRLSGSRIGAKFFMSPIPEKQKIDLLTLDATEMEASSQSFADELFQQIFVKRWTKNVVLHHPTERFKKVFMESAERAHRAHFITVIDR